jgi:hypothetical protein
VHITGHFAPAGTGVLLCLFPVYSHDKVFVFGRSIYFQQRIGFFGVVAAKEEPVARFAFTGTGQVEVHTGRQQSGRQCSCRAGFWSTT